MINNNLTIEGFNYERKINPYVKKPREEATERVLVNTNRDNIRKRDVIKEQIFIR